jgi:hypothetical protein
MDEAAEEYERCIALVPDFAYAHWSLASHRKASTPGARIARIESAKAGNPPEEQPFLDYALFREHDDAGHTERAWASLMSGATAKRASLTYDPQAEDAGFRMLEGMTAQAFEPTHPRDRIAGRVPIFILGMPRTGTTLLERILGGHGDVEAGGELNDFESALSLATNRFLRRYATPEAIEALQAADFAEVGAHLSPAHRLAHRRQALPHRQESGELRPCRLHRQGPAQRAHPVPAPRADGCVLVEHEGTVRQRRLPLQLRPGGTCGPLPALSIASARTGRPPCPDDSWTCSTNRW